MEPYIPDGTRCLIRPLSSHEILQRRSAVFCRIGRGYALHRVKALRRKSVLIANNHGHLDGWTTRSRVYGIYVGPVEGDV